MAERTLLGTLLLLSLHRTYAALDVFAPSPQRAFVTNDTVLNCTFSVDKQPLDLNFLAILWRFQEKVILRYDNKGFSTQDPRMSLNAESLRDGYASLHISNVTISDTGIYKCMIIYSPENAEKEILFEVLARPLLSILSTKVQRSPENTLTCKASGFFPPDIRIKWYRKGEVVRNQVIGKPQMYKDGTYQVNSTLTTTQTKDDPHQIFSCTVQHGSLEEPLHKDFQLNYEEEPSSNVVAVVCVVLALIITMITIGIVVFFWKQKYKTKGIGAFTVMDIEGPTKLIAGEEISLYCKATNVPENTSVTWLEKRGGEVLEIPESCGGDMGEEERLLDTQYGVKSWTEGPNYTSSLKFTPSVTEHKDVTFICRFSCGKQKIEKTFHCRDIYAKPQLLQLISRNLNVPGELKYLVTLEKFYPKYITIRWTHGVGEPQQPLTSEETFIDIPDGTYSVCSEVKIPEELLKDPEFKVRISWKHKSLDTMEYKDLSIRDAEYAWNPILEDIETPNLFHDTPVALKCNISEYFPDVITVTWLRRSENQELCEETDNVASRTIIPWKADDNTYSCTASLTIVPLLSVHQGAEYICRVDHPSLETPIEKKTEKLVVKAIPRMVEPIQITTRDFSRIYFSLILQNFYPKDIEVDWKYELKDKTYKLLPKNATTEHEDLTYDIISVGDIPMHLLTDPQLKVSVTWNHESMDEPETRTLTVRDLPWIPQVGEIIIPDLKEKKKTSLICNISECFSDHLSVSWSKKEPGTDSDPVITPLPNDDYKVSNKDQKETFSCQSSLTFTYLSKRDRGSEFICKVEHPNLEQPIQRSTGPIGLETHPMNEPSVPVVGEIIISDLKEKKKTSLTCNISEYFPDHLTVSWSKKEPGTDSDPVITPLPNDYYKVSNKDQKKKLSSCQSSLTFTYLSTRDRGSEFICKVKHPSLEHPIQRSTGPIGLETLPMNETE